MKDQNNPGQQPFQQSFHVIKNAEVISTHACAKSANAVSCGFYSFLKSNRATFRAELASTQN